MSERVKGLDGLISKAAPPSHPLYPEPPLQGRYRLRRDLCVTHLPLKFKDVGEGQVVVVEASGKLVGEDLDKGMEEREGRGVRWSYVPWTEAMEVSCRPWALRWKGLNEVVRGG